MGTRIRRAADAAIFGAPIAHEDHAQRACYTALHLTDELRRYSDKLRLTRGLNFSVRIGLNSGEVVVGKIGEDLRMDYTALGHTSNLAARMEQIAAPGRIYLAEPTAQICQGFFALRDLGRHQVRGLSQAVGVFELEGVGRMRTPELVPEVDVTRDIRQARGEEVATERETQGTADGVSDRKDVL